jgi:hypothetical protein
MLTAPSSNPVVLITQKFPTWESFNRWREAYLGVIIADRSIGHRAKTVATVIYLHLSKKTGACFPSYSEIARCAGIRRQNAVEAVKELIAAGHLRKLSRQDQSGFDTSNLYFPAGASLLQDSPFSLRDSSPSHSETLTEHILTPIEVGLESCSETPEEERSLPKGTFAQPVDSQPFSSSSLPWIYGAPRGAAGGGGAPSRYIAFDDPEMAVLELFERVTGQKYPRDKRGGWLLTAEQCEAIATAEGAVR